MPRKEKGAKNRAKDMPGDTTEQNRGKTINDNTKQSKKNK